MFYRNDPGVVLYQPYEFVKITDLIGCHANRKTKFSKKKYSKLFSSEVISGVKLKFCINVYVIILYINCVFFFVCVFFIAVAHVVSLLWQL